MLKTVNSVKFWQMASEALRELLASVSVVDHVELRRPETGGNVDLEVRLRVAGRTHTLICAVHAYGQPRHARVVMLRLQAEVQQRNNAVTPLFIAPYLSPEVRSICRAEKMGFMDLEGNAWLTFGSVFIERQVATKPAAERRELRSLFKPKSARVLRILLRDPAQAWKVVDLAKAADVSLGHVSNVRTALLDRGWARLANGGISLASPDAVLDSWRDAYQPPIGRRLEFYTTAHGKALERVTSAIRNDGSSGLAALSSFSAAHWLAPYGRAGTELFYTDERGLKRLKSALELSETSVGANVTITVVEDLGIFMDTVEPATGIICTSPVQTYLDLAASGERGREAADYLRKKMLVWKE